MLTAAEEAGNQFSGDAMAIIAGATEGQRQLGCWIAAATGTRAAGSVFQSATTV